MCDRICPRRRRRHNQHLQIPDESVPHRIRALRGACWIEDDKKDGRVTLLLAKDAQVNVVKRCSASQLETSATCGCEPGDVGVAEARPFGSIHPALAKLKAEILKIKGAIGTGAGSRYLKCETAYHDALVAGKDMDEERMKRDLCLLGIDEPGDPIGILW